MVEKKEEKSKNGDPVTEFQGSSPDEIAICTSMKRIGSEFKGSNLGVAKLDFFGEEETYQIKMVILFIVNYF